VHLRTIQINHQPNATIFQFISLTFVYSSTCFWRFPVHHQEHNDCSGSLWFYLRIVVTVVLCSWSGRPAGPTTNTRLQAIHYHIKRKYHNFSETCVTQTDNWILNFYSICCLAFSYYEGRLNNTSHITYSNVKSFILILKSIEIKQSFGRVLQNRPHRYPATIHTSLQNAKICKTKQ
jgi:hypothetical protein